MDRITLNTVAERSNLFTHLFKIFHTDLNDTAGTGKTLELLTGISKGNFVYKAAHLIRTNFDGGATSALALDVGWDAASGTDDADGIIAAREIHEDATEVPAGDANGAAFAASRTGYAFLVDGGKLTATLTSTGGNLTALTQGEVWVAVAMIDIGKLG